MRTLTPTTITYLGMTRPISEWARLLETTPQALRYRLSRGWPIEEVLEIVEHGQGRRLEHHGKCLSINQWAQEKGISAKTIRKRIKGGWPVSVAIEAGNASRLEDYEHEDTIRGLRRFLYWVTGYCRSTR